MNLYALSGLFIVITAFVVPPIILLNSRKEDRFVNSLWMAFNFAIGLYGLGIFFAVANSAVPYNEALFWFRVAYTGVTFIPVLFFHHSYISLGLKIKKKVLFLLYGISAVFCFLSAGTPYFFVLQKVFGGLWYPDVLSENSLANANYMAFVVYFFILVVVTIYKLWDAFRKASGEIRARYFYQFIGSLIGFGGGSTAFLPIFHIYFYPILNMTIPLYQVIISYATVRYSLFNTKVIAAEIVAGFMAVIFLIAVIVPESIVLKLVLIVGFAVTITVLVKSALSEAKTREELKYLNEHLQEKVAEQTVEIRRAYEVEKKARVELEELDKAKDQFILTTQHHLRTPLTIVKGYLQSVLGQKPQTIDEATKTSLTKAEEAADRIGTLVNEFLDISQMEVGKSILQRKPTNIKDLIVDVIKELESEIQKKNLPVTMDIQNDTVLNIDSQKMREGLLNIIDNSVKYNKTGGTISIKGLKVNHPIEKDKQIYRIIVEDTGIGIPTEELPQLFAQYFQRGKEAEKLYTTGRGIGLVVTKNIIQAHGGRIYAESKGSDKGARFTIELPI